MSIDSNNNGFDSSRKERVNISEWIAHAIADTGCSAVFGGHGGALVPLVNAICQHPDLQWVCGRNEHNAATMAAAYAKQTGRLGCVIATSGPGATNLLTGLMEATQDKLPLLAITGLKPTAQLGYAEFQDVNQSRIFAAAGVEWSKNAASANAAIPLLRDAVATALSKRTCAHLAIPMDIQAADSPLKLRHFCASHANLRVHPPQLDDAILQQTARMLVGEPTDRPPRNVIAVGVKACYYNRNNNNMSQILLDLAETLNAPVLTRLDAKGVVDERHPLSLGVIGVHGKPGLEASAALISSAECIISVGVEDATLLLCNNAGLQIRRLVELQPDAMQVGTRFNADFTILGDLDKAVQVLTEKVETLQSRVNKERRILMDQADKNDNDSKKLDHPTNKTTFHSNNVNSMYKHKHQISDMFAYMAYDNPRAENTNTDNKNIQVLPDLEKLGVAKVRTMVGQLWNAVHQGDWRVVNKMHSSLNQLGSNHDDDMGNDGNAATTASASDHEKYCHPSEVLHALSELRRNVDTDMVSREAVVTVDVGDVTLWAGLCLHLAGGSRVLYSEHLGTMGYALNAAVASILARPAPAGAVVLAGDGGFQMTLQEMATFIQHQRPGDKLLCVVFDNAVLGRVAFGFDDAKGCEISGPDYVALAQAYGGDGAVLNKTADAKNAMKKAAEATGLFVVHVRVDPNVKADMATFHDTSLSIMKSG